MVLSSFVFQAFFLFFKCITVFSEIVDSKNEFKMDMFENLSVKSSGVN